MAVPPDDRFAGASAVGTLASDPGSAGTTLTLTTGHGARFPAIASGERMFLRIIDANAIETAGAVPPGEIVTVTAHTANADTMTVTRGTEGTAAAAHAAGAIVQAVLTETQVEAFATSAVSDLPRHHGFAAWTCIPSELRATTSAFSAGNPNYHKMWVPESFTIASLTFYVATAGATLTAGQNQIGVYNSAGTLLGRNTGLATVWNTTGEKTVTLTAESGQSLALTGGPGAFVYVACLFNGTTSPQLRRFGDNAEMCNIGLTGAAGSLYRCGALGSALTALAATVTLTSLGSGSGGSFFAGAR